MWGGAAVLLPLPFEIFLHHVSKKTIYFALLGYIYESTLFSCIILFHTNFTKKVPKKFSPAARHFFFFGEFAPPPFQNV
jgi:hypothetical protein